MEGIAEAFNLTNRRNDLTRNTNFGPGAYPTNPSATFGQITAVGEPRTFQFGLRARFGDRTGSRCASGMTSIRSGAVSRLLESFVCGRIRDLRDNCAFSACTKQRDWSLDAQSAQHWRGATRRQDWSARYRLRYVAVDTTLTELR